MTKKRIRQMNSALRRRLTNRPAADWLPDGETFARALEAENYMQRFAPLFHGERLRCADVLALCRPELDALSGGRACCARPCRTRTEIMHFGRKYSQLYPI